MPGTVGLGRPRFLLAGHEHRYHSTHDRSSLRIADNSCQSTQLVCFRQQIELQSVVLEGAIADRQRVPAQFDVGNRQVFLVSQTNFSHRTLRKVTGENNQLINAGSDSLDLVLSRCVGLNRLKQFRRTRPCSRTRAAGMGF